LVIVKRKLAIVHLYHEQVTFCNKQTHRSS